MYKQLLLLLLSLQKHVTTDSAWTADWCLAFQSIPVGSSWYRNWHFLGLPLAPRPRKLTRKINCLANSKGLVNPYQRESGWPLELLADTRQKSQVRRDLKGAFFSDLCSQPWVSMAWITQQITLNYTANDIACLGSEFQYLRDRCMPVKIRTVVKYCPGHTISVWKFWRDLIFHPSWLLWYLATVSSTD